MRATHRTHLIALSLLLLAGLPRATSANWPFNPSVNVPLCTDPADQEVARAISDGNGGAIVAWVDFRNGGTATGGFGYDAYAQHVSAGGLVDQFWPVDGRALSSGVGDQLVGGMVSDGAGGAIVVLSDSRLGAYNVSAQRVSSAGTPLWTSNGVPICTDPANQGDGSIASDGAGGAFIAWTDYRNDNMNGDVYAQHVNASGVTTWAANGIPICTATLHQAVHAVVADGSGGAIVVWYDKRNGSDFDIYAQRVNAAGAVQWAANGVAVCTGADDQWIPSAVPDGAGGAIVVWHDRRNGLDYDIYAQRVDATGSTKWAPGGVAVCTASFSQTIGAIASDGAGGALVCWRDPRQAPAKPYAQRLNASGVMQWTPNGTAVSTTADLGFGTPVIASDGSGGAIVSWADYSGGTGADILAQRVLDTGSIPSSWPVNGRKLCTAPGDQARPTIVASTSGRAIVAWEDFRSGANGDIYSQLVAPSGFLAVPNPILRPIRDIPWDQGGFVNVQWDASYLDTFEPYGVDFYWVLRSAPTGAVASALAEGRVLSPEAFGVANAEQRAGDIAGRPGTVGASGSLVVTGTAASSSYWEPIRMINALHSVPGYSSVTPTTSDSVPGGNPLTAFMVIAYDATGLVVLPSDPESGYSVDNLPPLTPSHLTAGVIAGSTHLHWLPNPDPDVTEYRVYRGSTAEFVPTAATQVGAPADTGFTDVGSSGNYYKVSAVDIHGNEGTFALISPSETLDVPGGAVATLSLARPRPNPAHRESRIPFALPHDGRVTLAIYDVAGRLTRTLVEGGVSAGEHAADWDLRDRSGAVVSAGLYLVRLEVGGTRLTERLVVAGP